MTDLQNLEIPRTIPFMAWPGIPAAEGANLLALQYLFEQTLQLPHKKILQLQWKQLSLLTRHAKESVGFYQDINRYHWPNSLKGIEDFSELTVLTRSMVQEAGDSLLSHAIPKEHGAVSSIQTSGSTGKPIKAYRSALFNFFWKAFTLRDHLLHRRDFSCTLASIRPEFKLEPGQSHRSRGWGASTHHVCKTGDSIVMSSKSNIADQAKWLLKETPAYILTLPSNLQALAEYFLESGQQLSHLLELRTYGETLTPYCRKLCAEAFAVEIKDMYSSQEIGYMALQHPNNESYLVQSEGVYLEVLRDNGEACLPGEIGRVVVTSLQNFAMPLLRYEIGDYAQVAEPNPDGIGPLILERILGRTRNMLILPDGSKHWPSFPASLWTDIAAIKQFQLTQTTTKSIEVKLVVKKPLSEQQEHAIKAMLGERLLYNFDFKLIYMETISRAKSGKFEDFVSLLI